MFTFLQSSSLPSFDHFNISYGHKLSMSETVKPSVCGVTCLHICAQSSHNGGLIPKYCGSYLYLWSTTISQQGRWSLHEAISESVAWQKTEKRNVVFSFVEKLENLQQPEITQLDLFVLCYDDRPGIKRSPDNLKQVNSPLCFWFVRLQPPASGWSADWGTAGSPAAAAVQHHWEENT